MLTIEGKLNLAGPPSSTRKGSPLVTTLAEPSTRLLHDRLRSETRCELRFGPGDRGLYSTDASLYLIEPIGVAIPRTVDDVHKALAIAADLGAPVLPRGGATSLSGQVVGRALIIDYSKYLNRIGVVDRDRGLVRVEPGVVLDRLNAHLKPLGLMFGPDVSTSDRATLGGMIGNNSAGARSLAYGKTVDHVVELDVALDDGSPASFRPLDDAELAQVCRGGDRLGVIHNRVRAAVARVEGEIRSRYPRILRRVSGFNLDELVPNFAVRPRLLANEPWRFNLARLIVGSEGTLAQVVGAAVRVMPAPRAQGLVVLSFSSMTAALDRVNEIVATQPVSVELLDRLILDLAAANAQYARYLTFTQGRPESVLSAQFHADSQAELEARAEDLVRRFAGAPGVIGVHKSLANAADDDFWKVRKGGLALLMGMLGDAKPIAFVEDTAVAPERLREFYDRFEAILGKHKVKSACYGHADVGCLHIRPIINVKTPEGVAAVRSIAREVSDLVLEFGGAMSGEHGDGLARSLWNPKLFGPEIYDAFLAIKDAFDPTGRMNPGKVVNGPDLTQSLRLSPDYHASPPPETILDFAAQGGFAAAVEMCSGVGVCRKTAGGVMCPSFMITRDEQDSTRGRANALRLVMSGAIAAEGLASEVLDRALDLCLECKACKTECPSNVDMAKLKSEFLHQRSKTHPHSLRSLVLGNVHIINRLGSLFAPLANRSLSNRAFKRGLELILGIDRRRSLPSFARESFRAWFRNRRTSPRAGSMGKVILLDDCFTTYNDPEVGKDALRLLEACGYEIELAGIRCCGRPSISKGLLPQARQLAREAVDRLAPRVAAGASIVGIEPSCLLTFVDEYRDFRLGEPAERVANASRLADQFFADRSLVPELTLTPESGRALLHGHCQQRALVGTSATVSALSRIEGVEVKVLDSGCCGMAGSFGYEKGHYELSKALAERVLLPAASADPTATLVAPGFSCRSQLLGLAGIKALHPVQFLARHLVDSEGPRECSDAHS